MVRRVLNLEGEPLTASMRTEPEPVAERLDLLHVNHINAIVDGYQDTVDHFRGLYGAQFHSRIPGDEVDACLMSIGRVIFEFFAPKQRSERGQGRLLATYGDHYIGIEYEVPDLHVAKDMMLAKGMRILFDGGVYFLTHPADSFGVSFEIYDGDWNVLLARPRPSVHGAHQVAGVLA
jgi:hypothetical protein